MDKLKARDLDDLTLALMIEDHLGSANLRNHGARQNVGLRRSG